MWINGPVSPQHTRERAKDDIEFQARLLQYVSQVVTECMPPEYVDDRHNVVGHRVFQPLLSPDDPSFNDAMSFDLYDIINARQMHNPNHTPTCFKHGNATCRSHFPRPFVEVTTFDQETGVIHIKRDHPFLNGYNPWIAIITRANHDCQFLFTKNHALAVIHYVMKYISKPETSLHSKLTIAAAVRRSINDQDANINIDMGKRMLLKTYNKLDSHREVGIPEALSHLLDFPDHFTEDTFQSINTTHLFGYMTRIAQTQVDVTPDSDGIYDANIIRNGVGYTIVTLFEDYVCRGDALQTLCLYDYCSLFYKQNRINSGFPFAVLHPQHFTHRQYLRTTKPAIPTLLGKLLFLKPSTEDGEARNTYYCLLSGLFFPWSYDRPIKSSNSSWEEYYAANCHTLSSRLRRYIDNLDLLHKSQEESRIDRLQRQAMSYDERIEDRPDVETEEPTIEPTLSIESTTTSIHSPLVQQAIDLATLPAPEWYVQEALTFNWTNGYFSTTAFTGDAMNLSSPSSIYYCDIPSKQLNATIKNLPGSSESNIQSAGSDSSAVSIIQPHVYLSSTPMDIGQSIVDEFSLNEEQTIAFRIIANHTVGQSTFGEQLRMGIFGEGGTGKSRLIMAIRAWFTYLRQSGQLVVTAMTGTAAFKINGTTLHSAVGIRVEKNDRGGNSKVAATHKTKWADRQYLIIDEVSMMDCSVISRLHTKLGLLKSRPSDLFGGVNMIFLGDFLQFPAVSQMDVYLNNHRCEAGHRLWRSLNAVVILKKQMRQSEDPEYASLLSRIRIRSPTETDIIRLNSRIGVPLPHMSSLPVVVRRHSVRHAINMERLQQYSDALDYTVTHCIANIQKRVGITIQDAYQCKYGESGMDGDAVLALAPGVPLLITRNINQHLGTIF